MKRIAIATFLFFGLLAAYLMIIGGGRQQPLAQPVDEGSPIATLQPVDEGGRPTLMLRDIFGDKPIMDDTGLAPAIEREKIVIDA